MLLSNSLTAVDTTGFVLPFSGKVKHEVITAPNQSGQQNQMARAQKTHHVNFQYLHSDFEPFQTHNQTHTVSSRRCRSKNDGNK